MPEFLQIMDVGPGWDSNSCWGGVDLPGPGGWCAVPAGPDLQWDLRIEVKRDEISKEAGLIRTQQSFLTLA